ncbi:hypothetical protein G6F59_017943 [Rhizopus arrhizus]|nr:hypothetical protein G6F59_017943 [Rhizopus arrhizus]
MRWSRRASMVTGTAACRWARAWSSPTCTTTARSAEGTSWPSAPRRTAPGLPAPQRHPGKAAAVGEDGLDRPARRGCGARDQQPDRLCALQPGQPAGVPAQPVHRDRGLRARPACAGPEGVDSGDRRYP